MEGAMLTDTRIRNTKAGKTPKKLTDSGGLYIEVRPTGAKLWRYRYRYVTGLDADGKKIWTENLYALGEFCKAPEGEKPRDAEARRLGRLFTLGEARTERERCRGLVKQGIHPAQERRLADIKRQHEAANTFEAVAREWLEQNKRHWTARVYEQRKRLLEREVFPEVGSLPIRNVTPAHLLAILKRLEQSAPSFAILARQAMAATFRLAISTLRAESDPVAPLADAIKAPPTQHKTPLEAKEIPGFFKKLEEYSGAFPTKAAVRLVWLTLVRTNEAVKAKWAEFDLDNAVWQIPGERMKKRSIRPHVVPLPSQAVEVLTRLKAVTGDGEYLFPNRSDHRRPAAVTLLNKAVSSMGYTGKFSPHAIRTTGSTALNEMGFNGDWVERQLGHHERNESRASYNGAKYLDQRRDMMQTWADHIDALCKGGKVVPIRAGRAA
jgi:integrase